MHTFKTLLKLDYKKELFLDRYESRKLKEL